MDKLMVVGGFFDSFTWWVIYLILLRIGGFAVVRGNYEIWCKIRAENNV